MKKIYLSAFALVTFTVLTQAQTRVGILAGANLSTQHSNTGKATRLLSTDAFRGYHAGFTADIPLSANFYVQPQLVYAKTGAKYKGSPGAASMTLHSISLPVHLLYKLPLSFGKLVAGAGGSIGYNVAGHQQQSGETIKLYKGGSKDWKRTEFSANAIAGIELNNGFFAHVNYEFGLTDINKTSAVNIKNRAVAVSLGYLLPLH